MRPHAHPDAADLLRTEHAVVRVLASAGGEAEAYPGAAGRDRRVAGLRGRALAARARTASCAAPRRGRRTRPPAAELAAGVWDVGRPRRGRARRRVRVPAARRRRDGRSRPPRRSSPTPTCWPRWTASARRSRSSSSAAARSRPCARATRARARSSTPPSTASSRWTTTATWSRSTARPSGRSATAREEMIGRELAELIVPPTLREAHRRGLDALPAHRALSAVGGHPLELEGMREDGSEFPVELIVTRADLPGPPLFCGYLRDVTEARERERDLRRLADEQAALRRVATAVAAEHRPAARVRASSPRRSARLLGAQSSNMVRFDDDGDGDGRRRLERGRACATSRSATTVRMDGDTASARVYRTRRAGARRQLRGRSTASSPRGCASSASARAVAAPIFLDGRLWGAVIVSSVEPEPFPPGAEQRIADFAELAAQALANAQARAELAASRARIVAGRRRRAAAARAQPARRRAAAARLAGADAAAGRAPAPRRRRPRRAPARSSRTRCEELRELARGIHPAVLTERGLEPAVEALADRAPLPVELDVCARPSGCRSRSRRPPTTSSPRR